MTLYFLQEEQYYIHLYFDVSRQKKPNNTCVWFSYGHILCPCKNSSYSYWANVSTKHTMQDCLYIFYSVFFPYLFWLPDLSESIFILHEFARLWRYGLCYQWQSSPLFVSEKQNWLQYMEELATERLIAPIMQRNIVWEEKSHPLINFSFKYFRAGRRRLVPCFTALFFLACSAPKIQKQGNLFIAAACCKKRPSESPSPPSRKDFLVPCYFRGIHDM